MNELLNFNAENLPVGDFLKVHTSPECQVETVPLGIIVGGAHALTIKKDYETQEFMLRCVFHNITSEKFMQEVPKSEVEKEKKESFAVSF